MQATPLYRYAKSRRQRSLLFLKMALASLAYIAGLFGYEHYTGNVTDEPFRTIYLAAFSVSAAVLFFIMWWHLKNPAEYVATITRERMVVHYPGSDQWSFDVAVADIERVEYRNTQSHAGSGISDQGLVLKNGKFIPVSMNYGNNLRKMVKALQQANADITFSNLANTRFEGLPFSKKAKADAE